MKVQGVDTGAEAMAQGVGTEAAGHPGQVDARVPGASAVPAGVACVSSARKS